MVFLVAQSGYSVERIADDLSLIPEDHIDPGWRCNIWHVSDRDKDMLLDSVMGDTADGFFSIISKKNR